MSRSLRAASLVALALALLVVLAAPRASGYAVLKNWGGNTTKWGTTNIPWSISTNIMSDVTQAQLESALSGAFAAWAGVSCTNVGFTFAGYKAWDPGNTIHFTFKENNWDPSVGDALAYAVSDSNNSGTITSSDIVFNAVDATWSTSTSAPWGTDDVQGVATHEIGHTLGLDHSRDPQATMFFSGGSVQLRSLAEDDQRGVCFLYPATPFSAGQACDACDSSANCANGSCLDWGGGHTYCGQNCTSSASCPEGFSCANIDSTIPYQCVPDNDFCHQYGQNIALGEPCYGHETCQSGLCLPLENEAFCSQECTSSCPSGFSCMAGYCVKAGFKPYGAECSDSSECQSAYCAFFTLQGVCTTFCGENGGSCLTGHQCYDNAICVPPGTRSIGAECGSPTQCAGTYCLDGSCAQQCGATLPCPEGTTCTGGFCTGVQIGGSCGNAYDCPTGTICDSTSKSCIVPCNPLKLGECPDGRVCEWLWNATAQTITGTCVKSNGGALEGESCEGTICESDLICRVDEYGNATCHRDCKLQANNLGCATGDKCVTLDDPDDPKRGVCVPKVAVPPVDEGPAEDTGGPTEDMGGPTEDMGGPAEDMGGPTEDTGGPTADTGGPTEDMGGPTEDTGGPVDDTGGPADDTGATEDTGSPYHPDAARADAGGSPDPGQQQDDTGPEPDNRDSGGSGDQVFTDTGPVYYPGGNGGGGVGFCGSSESSGTHAPMALVLLLSLGWVARRRRR